MISKSMLGNMLDFSHPLNRGLVAYYPMNEGNGDKIQDLSMNGNHGTLTNMDFPPIQNSGWTPGRKGVGLAFDGSNDYVTTPIMNGFANGITLGVWVKNTKTNLTSLKYQAESIGGASTGDNWTTYRRGRMGIDTPGGTLVDYVVPNTDFGTQMVAIYGYQTDTSVFAGTFLIKDETTGITLGSGNLFKVGIGASDKRMNNPFVFTGNGHSYHVYVYFSDTTDVFIDYIYLGRGAYDGIISKANKIELMQFSDGYRVYVNSGSRIVAYSTIKSGWQHLMVTYDNATVKLYIDGVLYGTASYASSITDSAQPFLIGKGNQISPSQLWGVIDTVRIYNRVLSAAENFQLFQEQLH